MPEAAPRAYGRWLSARFRASWPGMKRRSFLAGSALAVAAPALVRGAWGAPASATFPFSVASGDPTADAVILWTRLARAIDDPAPVSGGPVEVEWLVASDERLVKVVRRGTAIARPALGHSVHVDVRGLEPDRLYWYAFRLGGLMSPVGRTRTLPTPQAQLSRFRFNMVCCQNWEAGYFDAYDGMADDDASFVLHLGDYIYDTSWGGVRAHDTKALPRTLEDYRRRHALYRQDAALRRAHARMPFLLVPDNHDAVDDGSGDPATLARRAAAYQAWYEFLPVRYPPRPPGSPFMAVRRGHDIGGLLRLTIPDTRQHRDKTWICAEESDKDFALGVFRRACAASEAPNRTMLGAAQEAWLTQRLARSPARWNVLASTVMMTPLDMRHDGEIYRYLPSWDGYPAERTRILDAIAAAKVANPVILGGDIHATVISDVVRRAGEPPAKAVTSEFVTTSLSSLCPPEMAGPMKAALPANPHIRYCEPDRRGYMRFTVTDRLWTGDVRVIGFTDRPCGTVTITRSYVIEDGAVGVKTA